MQPQARPSSACTFSGHPTVIASDLQNMAVDMDSGSILRHGTFKDVEASLDTLQAAGSTSLYVVGALERDNGWGDGDEAIAASDTKAVVTAAADGNESDERFVFVDMYLLCVFMRKPMLCLLKKELVVIVLSFIDAQSSSTFLCLMSQWLLQ